MATRKRKVGAGAMVVVMLALALPAYSQQTIRIGVNTATSLQVGRDTVAGVNMAVEELNARGGLLGRRLQMIVADEGEAATEGPKMGIAAVNKLTGEDHADVLIGGYDSGVTLAELPHISRARTLFLNIGSASPAIQQKVKDDYAHYKYLFRVSPLNSIRTSQGLADFITGKLKGELGYERIAFLGENAKFVQDMIPFLRNAAIEAGMQVPIAEFFDVQTQDFSPVFAKVKDSGVQYLFIVLSHSASDVFVKQWYDAKVPVPIGGIDVKSMDADFFNRVGGKSISEVTTNYATRAPLTDKTLAWWDRFVALYRRAPVYTASGAYDAVFIYADAVTRAGSTEADALIGPLEQTSYVGVRGKVEFDATHDVEDGPGRINQLFVQWQENGARVVVWPNNLATGKMIDPPWMRQH